MKSYWALPAVSAVLSIALLSTALSAGAAKADMGSNDAISRATLRVKQESSDGPRQGGLRPVQRNTVSVGTRGIDPRTTAGALAREQERPHNSEPTVLDLASLDAMPEPQGDSQWQCLSEAIYFESRGEPFSGQIAVAEVVLNRVDDPRFPDTVCSVTRQGVGSGRACQFSYACDGRSDKMTSAVSRERSQKLARLMLDGRARMVTDGATYFHTRSVRPGWARQMTKTVAIGQHLFYRPAVRVASR